MRRTAGFSLIEVLIALVLVSVGLIGTAKLTATSLKNTNSSLYRSQATFLADDILDRMRANVAAAKASNYDIDPGPVYGASSGTLENYDCHEWVAALAATLPQGQGTVSVSAAGIATITIQWDGGDSSFSTKSQL